MKTWKKKFSDLSIAKQPDSKNILDKNSRLFFFFILLISFFVFFSTLKNSFLIYDDPESVTDNILITSLNIRHIKLFFTTPLLFMYTPLTYVSLALDFKMGGLNPMVFHFSNLLLHLFNIILVFIFIKNLSNKSEIALITAALFAIHPLNADTVSWISTRSNLLFALFFLASLIYYLSYLKNNLKLKFYFISMFFFLLSLLSKSSAIALPFILVMMDYFHQRKINLKNLAEKIPFFFIAFVFGLLTLYFRSDASKTETPFNYSLIEKFFIFCYSIIFYLLKLVSPIHLSAVYSYPQKLNGMLPFEFYFAPLILILLIILIVRLKKNQKELLFGFLFFFISIAVSLVGFLEDGFHANRYAYISYIGLFFIIGNCYHWFAEKNKVFISILVLILIIYCVLTRERVYIWKDSITLFNDVIKKQPANAFAFNSRGIAKYEKHDYASALGDYSHAISLNPIYAGAFYNRAIAFYQVQDFSKSMNDYSKAIELNPFSAKSYAGRGIIKMDVLNDLEGAIRDYNKAISIHPDFAQAYYNRGLARLRSGAAAGACEDWQKVKQLGYSRADDLIYKYCH